MKNAARQRRINFVEFTTSHLQIKFAGAPTFFPSAAAVSESLFRSHSRSVGNYGRPMINLHHGDTVFDE